VLGRQRDGLPIAKQDPFLGVECVRTESMQVLRFQSRNRLKFFPINFSELFKDFLPSRWQFPTWAKTVSAVATVSRTMQANSSAFGIVLPHRVGGDEGPNSRGLRGVFYETTTGFYLRDPVLCLFSWRVSAINLVCLENGHQSRSRNSNPFPPY